MLMGACSKPFLPLECWGVKFGKDCSPSNQQHFAAPMQVQDENQEGRLAGPFLSVTVPQPQAGSTFSGGLGLQVALAEHWEITWRKQASDKEGMSCAPLSFCMISDMGSGGLKAVRAQGA